MFLCTTTSLNTSPTTNPHGECLAIHRPDHPRRSRSLYFQLILLDPEFRLEIGAMKVCQRSILHWLARSWKMLQAFTILRYKRPSPDLTQCCIYYLFVYWSLQGQTCQGFPRNSRVTFWFIPWLPNSKIHHHTPSKWEYSEGLFSFRVSYLAFKTTVWCQVSTWLGWCSMPAVCTTTRRLECVTRHKIVVTTCCFFSSERT